MSLSTKKIPYRFETPVTPSPRQQRRSQVNTPSSYQEHVERARSAQDDQPQGKQQLEGSKPDPWSERLGERTVKQFEELARNFDERETIADIVDFSNYLDEQLKDDDLVRKYNAWAREYFRPPPPKVLTVNYPADGYSDFMHQLQRANWNVRNDSRDMVYQTVSNSRGSCNEGLLMLGAFQGFWLTLQLEYRPIRPQKTDPQLLKLHGIPDRLYEPVLGLRYKPIGDKSTARTLFIAPLGKRILAESRLAANLS